VLDEHRTSETRTLKSGQPGKPKVTYAEPDDALKWLWKFVVCRAPCYAESARGGRRFGCSAGMVALVGSA
jgi:hypothetical protein